MNYSLITPTESNQILARDLYKFLELSPSQFTRWAKKNIKDNQYAIETEDYIAFDTMSNGRTIADYWLEIDFAKKLAMLANSEMGEKARQYFIECEKKAKSIIRPKELTRKELAQYWLEAEEKSERLEKENQQLLQQNAELANRDLEVRTQKEYKWKNEELQNERGRTINWYVMQYFFEGDYSAAHDKAKDAYYNATGIRLPSRIKYASPEQKKDYLDWLSKHEIN